MQRLTILYDPGCAFCRRCVEWLRDQPKLIDLEFLAGNSDFARLQFPELDRHRLQMELTVVDDEGGVYTGNDAYIICLFALKEYRGWSIRLSDPSVRPYVRKALGAVTRYRHTLSELFSDG